MLFGQCDFLLVEQARAAAASGTSAAPARKPVAKTVKPALPQKNLVVVMVENSLLNDSRQYGVGNDLRKLSEWVVQYTQNIQNRLPHTRAIVVGVDSTEPTDRIATALEKLYFDGVGSKQLGDATATADVNKLSGVVLVGEVPIPLVYEADGVVSPSLYPYTDFDRKRYIFNHNSGHFELNDAALKPNPEVWHGVIVPPSKDGAVGRQQLGEYFYKNAQYSTGEGEYAQFDQRLLAYDFPAVDGKMNESDYLAYKRRVKYLEEVVFQRYSKNLLRGIVQEFMAEVEPDQAPAERTPPISDEAILSFTHLGLKLPTDGFLRTWSQVLSSYFSRLNTYLDGTGRWGGGKSDTLGSLVAGRDAYSEQILAAKMVELEKRIDTAINGVQQGKSLLTNINIKISDYQSDREWDDEAKQFKYNDLDETRSFDLQAYIAGKLVSTINSFEECGLLRGQKRPTGVAPLVNNSAQVEANRTYDITDENTRIMPKEGDDNPPPLEETPEYHSFGKCVSNNAVAIHEENANADPAYCQPNTAVFPVFDLGGSKEVGFEFYEPDGAAPASNRIPAIDQCSLDKMSFLQPAPLPAKGLYDDNSYFAQCAYNWVNQPLLPALHPPTNQCNFMGIGNVPLAGVAVLAHTALVDQGVIPADYAQSTLLNDPTNLGNFLMPHNQLNRVVQALLPNDGVYGEVFFKHPGGTGDGDNFILFQLTGMYGKKVSSVIRHNQPTEETVNLTRKTLTLPQMPLDGIRYVEFDRADQHFEFEYPNFFRVEGESQSEVMIRFLQLMSQKNDELNQKLGYKADVINLFLAQNLGLADPIAWRQLGIDEKHVRVLEKYLDKGSDMLTPAGPSYSPPLTKPKGYEMVHLVAEGDERGFQFGFNASHLPKTPKKGGSSTAVASQALTSGATAPGPGAAPSGPPPSVSTLPAKCGDPSGVEIDKWFDAMQCWIEEEVSKMDKLISLDNACGGQAPAPTLDPAEEDALNQTLDTALSVENPKLVPVRLEVSIDRKTIVKGESVPVGVKVLNSSGGLVVGYVENPLRFALGDGAMGRFEKNNVSVFTGEERVVLTASDKVGDTTLTVSLGSVQSTPIPIRVVDHATLSFTAERTINEGQAAYRISASVLDPDGLPVTDVDGEARLVLVRPADGILAQSGRLAIKSGVGVGFLYPNPASHLIDVAASHDSYESETVHIIQPPNLPFKIVLDTPPVLEVGQMLEIPVKVADVNGLASMGFNGSVQVALSDASKSFADLITSQVVMASGKGILRLKTKRDTGTLHLEASKEGLVSAAADLPLVARIDSADWSGKFPQALFSSFVGFPAGDFQTEDYFGGVQLFRGKTEAVFSVMNTPSSPAVVGIRPNYKVQTTNARHQVAIQPLDTGLSLQVFDQKNLKSLVSTVAPFDFDSVALWDAAAKPVHGTLYVQLTDTTYRLEHEGDQWVFYDPTGLKVLSVSKDRLRFTQVSYDLLVDPVSDFDGLDLILSNGDRKVGRLRLDYVPRTLDSANFAIDQSLAVRRLFDGKSTADPAGLVLYNPAVKPDPKKTAVAEYYGFEGDTKYIVRFGGGSPAGEAVRYSLPYNGVLLGDPTITLRNPIATSLNYDNTVGRQLYQDSEGSKVMALTNLDFNSDKIQDVAAVMEDGRIRLFEGGYTDPPFIDRGNMAYLADGVLSANAFDFEDDGYRDLVISTREGRLAVLSNDGEVLTRSNQKLKVSKQVYQVLMNDMDHDGYDDLVTMDSLGDIRIFYNQSSVLVSRGRKPPFTPREQLPENGVLVGNYGFSIKLGANLKSDLQVRFPAMPEPKSPVSAAAAAANLNEGAPIPITYGENGEAQIPEPIAEAFRERNDAAVAAAQQTGTTEIPKLPWPEGEAKETYFAPLSDHEPGKAGTTFAVLKTVVNRDRPTASDLDLGEALKYRIEITSSQDVVGAVFADTVPDSLALEEKSVKCVSGPCAGLKSVSKDIYLFLSSLNLKAGQKAAIEYEVTVKRTPRSAIILKKIKDGTPIDVEVKGQSARSAVPADEYTDILVSPQGNRTGQLIVYFTSGSSRAYHIGSTVREPTEVEEIVEQHTAALDKLKNIKELPENPTDAEIEEAMAGAETAKEVMGDTGMTDAVDNFLAKKSPEECSEEPEACAAESASKTMDDIGNMSCMGGGCFPMPFNLSFMSPGGIPFAMPLVAFPATLTAGPYIIPVPSLFGMAPSPMGATTVKGTYNSMLRFYTIPTLTGGVDLALCWLTYAGEIPVPPPAMPIPYYPPSANCMSFALPMSIMPPCKALEMAMGKAMDAANSVVSDANSGISAVNNGSGVPTDMSRAEGEKGAGGMEIGLATNLGGQQSFEPPAKSFSNKHPSSFDTIGGVLASWLDRQLLEVMNKLLTLPTIRVILPDTQAMFAADTDEINKRAALIAAPIDTSGSDSTTAIESTFNSATNKLEQIYSLLDAMPVVNVNEKSIDFKIPWLSYSQIQDFTRQLEYQISFYEKKVESYKDQLSKFSCPDPNQETADCVQNKILGQFVTNLDAFQESLQKNVEVVQSYMKFPRDFILFKQQLADYIRQISCIIDNFNQTFNGWLSTIQEQLISWVEIYYTILEIVKNIQKMIDIFPNFEKSCDACTNERNANFGWVSLLGLVIPDIPIVKLPKWPDIVLDLTDMQVALNIEMPRVNFVVEPIQLPTLPLIDLPDLPQPSDLRILLDLPPLPVLPSLPELPKLPPIPTIPKVDLPTLPPPPKIPDIGSQLEVPMQLLDLILKAWCLVKKSFAPIPEGYLKDHSILLTTRPAYLTPLDLLKPKIGDIGGLDTNFNEVRINVTTYLGIRFKAAYEEVAKAAKVWNGFATDFPAFINSNIQGAIDTVGQGIQSVSDEAGRIVAEAEQQIQKMSEKAQKALDSLGQPTGNVDAFFGQVETQWRGLMDPYTDEWYGPSAKEVNQSYIDAVLALRPILEKTEFEWAPVNEVFLHGNLVGWLKDPASAVQDLKGWVEQNQLMTDELKSRLEALALKAAALKPVSSASSPTTSASGRAEVPSRIASTASPYVQSMVAKIGELAKSIDDINRTSVDYRKIKSELGVPDASLPSPKTSRRIEKVRESLLAYGERLDSEAKAAANATDVVALLESGKQSDMKLAQASVDEPLHKVAAAAPGVQMDGKALSQARKIERKAPTLYGSEQVASSTPSDPAYCAGSCLIDPKTNQTVEFISHFDFPGTVQTAFVPTLIDGQSDVVYSDGSSLYLKPNLAVRKGRAGDPYVGKNTVPTASASLFSVDDFFREGDEVLPPMGSVNMLNAALTESGAATFTWLDPTDPEFYGMGIELERSILGYDIDHQANGLPDLTVILLPAVGDKPPRVLVDDKPVDYGTLATSFASEEEARARFGVQAKAIVTGAQKIFLPTANGVGIKLNANRAVLFDRYEGPAYRLKIDNGFYHIRSAWFAKSGKVSNTNHNELLSPQAYAASPAPVDLGVEEIKVPVYKEGEVPASRIFMDPSDSYQYYWDVNQDGLMEKGPAPEFDFAARTEPASFTMDMVASKDLQDESFDRYKKPFTVTVYAPEIALDEKSLNEKAEIRGSMTPASPDHDLTGIPFSLFRQRWGVWKNLGLLRQASGDPTTPPLSSRGAFRDSYFTNDAAGSYLISDFTKGPSSVLVSDQTQKEVAKVRLGTGQVEVLDGDYTFQAVPASRKYPTRIAILKRNFRTVLSNVYFVADGNTDVSIVDAPLGAGNVESLGVTIGDENGTDAIVAKNVPGNTLPENYPGGAVIFDKGRQAVIAMVSSTGAVRLMEAGFNLRIKNPGKLDEKVVFQIVDSKERPVFDVFIAADFDNLVIRQDEVWSELNATIGYLRKAIQPLFASLVAQVSTSKPSIPKSSEQESPFVDVAPDNPYFEQILDLYNRRIITGFTDSTFRPAAKIGRAEFVKIALGATDCTDCSRPTMAIRKKYSSVQPFPDETLSAWHYFCIAIAKELGMVTGYGDGLFRPERNISRSEAVAVLLRQTKMQLQPFPENVYLDVPSDAWYRDYIHTAVQIGLIPNHSGFLLPNEEITRGEFAFMASTVGQLKDCRLKDTDGDGIPDYWEIENGLAPLDPSDASLDPDGDGASNLDEFKANTDPNDVNSYPKVVACPCAGNPNQNDTDGDGTIDACDTDADNDAVANEQCVFDSSGLIIPEKIQQSEDNCVFVPNADQKDSNGDRIGDVCLAVDLCDGIPEDVDGIHDADGCPEVFDDTAENDPGAYVNRGPACYFLDYEADLVKGDKLMTAITDVKTHDTVYKSSNEVEYKPASRP